MTERRSLIIDADLELVDASGAHIILHLESGQGVVELSDAALLRKFIKDSLLSPQGRSTLRRMLQTVKFINPQIDISVIGKRIARVDSKRRGGYICALLGLPNLRIRPVALLRVWFK